MTSHISFHRIEETLSLLVHLYFKPTIQFQIKLVQETQFEIQFVVPPRTPYRFTIRKIASQNLIQALTKTDYRQEQLEVFYQFLAHYPATASFDWDTNITRPTTVDDALIEQAQKLLTQHHTQTKKEYFTPIQKLIEDYPGDISFLKTQWKAQIAPYYPVIEQLTLSAYRKTFTRESRFATFKLSTPVASITLSADSAEVTSLLKPNESAISRLSQTRIQLISLTPIISKAEQLTTLFEEVKLAISNQIKKDEQFKKHKKVFNALEIFQQQVELRFNYQTLKFSIDNQTWEAFTKLDTSPAVDILTRLMTTYLNHLHHTLQVQLDELRQGGENPEHRAILQLLSDVNRKGMTTYLDILKGSTTAKMKDNGYHKLASYGVLSSYTKDYIQDQIQQLIRQKFIQEGTFRASFGRYIGLSLTEKGEKGLSLAPALSISHPSIPSSEFQINNSQDFKRTFLTVETQTAKQSLIQQLSHCPVFTPIETLEWIDFIKSQRPRYRDCETELVTAISQLTPRHHKDLILLNATFETGKTKDTLLQWEHYLNETI